VILNKILAGSRFLSVLVAVTLILSSAACGTPERDEGGGSLQVVATTTFVGDVVGEIGGEAQVVPVSRGVETRTFAGPSQEMEEESGEHDHEENSPDPHVWLDPWNVVVWTENIESALGELDPAGADVYRENGRAYREELHSLDRWIQSQVEGIPPEDRKLVTDHLVFGYFAERYGFELVGAVVPAPTTEAQPSGQQLAQLQDLIQEYDVQAIFVGRDFDPSLAERMAEDAGIQLVPLYFGSLTAADGPAGTYLEYMRTNVRAMVEALDG